MIILLNYLNYIGFFSVDAEFTFEKQTRFPRFERAKNYLDESSKQQR